MTDLFGIVVDALDKNGYIEGDIDVAKLEAGLKAAGWREPVPPAPELQKPDNLLRAIGQRVIEELAAKAQPEILSALTAFGVQSIETDERLRTIIEAVIEIVCRYPIGDLKASVPAMVIGGSGVIYCHANGCLDRQACMLAGKCLAQERVELPIAAVQRQQPYSGATEPFPPCKFCGANDAVCETKEGADRCIRRQPAYLPLRKEGDGG